MKPKLGIAASAVALCFALHGSAADRPVTTPDSSTATKRSENLMMPTKASEVMGQEVVNRQNEKLGKVEELYVDIDSGRVALVVVDSGGVLGVGAKKIGVPPRSFSYDVANKSWRLDVDQVRFKANPSLDVSGWDKASPTNQLAAVYRAHGQEPYFAEMKAAASGPVWVEKASKIIGRSVVNQENKKCGDVDNLIVDLPAGRLVLVVISSGGFLGLGDALNAVPPDAFDYTASRDALRISLSKEELARAANFKSTAWPDFKDSEYSARVYRSYGMEPYFNVDADNTKRNVRDRQEDRLTPFDQGTSDADVQTTRRIRQEILAREGLSQNARNVKVITANGRVTLRGPVKDDAERQIIAEIAGRIAQAGRVDNQLEVQTNPKERE